MYNYHSETSIFQVYWNLDAYYNLFNNDFLDIYIEYHYTFYIYIYIYDNKKFSILKKGIGIEGENIMETS